VSAPRPRTVLLVEDEAIVAHDLRSSLAELGYHALAVASSSEEAMARAAEKCPDIALVDIRIKGKLDGTKTAQLLQERFGVPIVYLTAHADSATLERALATHPYGYLVKPVKPVELRSAIEIALQKHEAETLGASPDAPSRHPVATPAATRNLDPRDAEAVRAALERVLASPDFDAPRRSREFLRFIVEETLGGRGDGISQTAIATQVFGRREDFDGTVDPIVRIQAGRLRRSLERYYLLSGKRDAVRIELPRGSYVPVLRAHEGGEAAPVPDRPPTPEPPAAIEDDWPVVVVNPFEASPPGGSELEAIRLTEELALELGRYRDVRPRLGQQTDPQEPWRARFALGGRVRRDDGGVLVTAQLLDRTTGEQIWGDEYHTLARPGRWNGPPEDIARVIAARVGAEEGIIVQLLASERRKRVAPAITPYNAILLSYDFFLARDPQSLLPALTALREVVKAEPECGLAWIRLARLHIANHNFEATSIPTPIDDAISYAQHAVRVDPASRRARCILASALLTRSELEAVRAEMEEALRLTPDSLVYLEIIGYLLTLAGDVERGPALIRTARERNPHWLPQAGVGLWFDHLRQGDFSAAYQVALEYRDPTFFWRSVMRGSCLGLLGRTGEARAEVAELLQRKPDFATRGRTLIGYYVKFPEVMDRVVEGLARGGLRLA
jgi:adenylate cyclase